ncbi:MAG: aspartate-semialdehyde dehydrogenase [Luteitalea sp.]|nr:aspartate-semialdehyde dehydrogenase [Luteitalea sp.]
MSRIDVGVLGATGMVGQQFVRLLAGHPWFRLTWLAASERSAGKAYRDAAAWRLADVLPDEAAQLIVEEPVPGKGPRLIFSGLDAAVAGEVEGAFAASGHLVVSNARNFRMEPTVPLLVPEVNADHLALVPYQRQEKAWPGAIVTNPNCSTIFLAMALAPLRVFGLESAVVTTLQAISGAGYPGVASLDIAGNVVPFIGGEEEKIESETKKILGALQDRQVVPHALAVSAHTTRVPVVDGHIEMVSVRCSARPSLEDVRRAFAAFRGRPQEHGLPSAPEQPLVYLEEANRPQPRLDVERDRGMVVCLGRLRPCSVLDFKFVALGHNTVRGAAGAAILNAELMRTEGLLAD